MSRVVIIGAGVGGLATAARLAVKGHAVTVVERSAVAGGKVARHARDGFVFDTGPNLFTIPAVYRDLFVKTGGALEDAVDLRPVDPAFDHRFADGSRVRVPGAGAGRVASAFGDALGADAGDDWRRLMERAGHMWRLTREPVLQSPRPGWRTLARMSRPRDLRVIAPWRSLRHLGRSTLRDPRLRQVLDRYATYTGSDPRRAPAVLATIPYVEATFGVWHLGGGVATIADALVTRCQERRVDVRLATEVAHIDVRDGAVRGVVLAGDEHLPADIVVANADASSVLDDLLPDSVARHERRRMARTTRSLGVVVVMLALRGRTPDRTHHTVWYPEHTDPEFDAIFGRTVSPPADPVIHACVPDDPSMHPADSEAWTLMVNVPAHGSGPGRLDWRAPGLADRYATHLVDVLAARGTDIRDRILWHEVRTPADLEDAAAAPGGAIYGWSSNGPRAAFARPANTSSVRGLYLVGGSVHPGGGLPLVGMGAETVTGLIGRA